MSLATLLQERILVLDGGMGTMVQAADLGPEDFGGEALDGCNEHLVLTRPDVVRSIHDAYLDAGADIIETNTFGATAIVLAEYDLQHLTREINLAAARIAAKPPTRPAHRKSPASSLAPSARPPRRSRSPAAPRSRSSWRTSRCRPKRCWKVTWTSC